MTTADNGPANRRPPPGAIDQAGENVKKIQSDLDQSNATAQATALPTWPDTAAPWMLYYSLSPKDTLILLQFSHEAGPTP
ncbi:MAG TPA: hypothetical protein VK731_05825 [Candidatus Cybelea sp.]|nr:hypothetical protein [Candidatus Cybelea sp.]